MDFGPLDSMWNECDVRIWDEYVPLYIVEQFSRIWIWIWLMWDAMPMGRGLVSQQREQSRASSFSTALILYGIRIHLEFGEYANIVSILLQLNMTWQRIGFNQHFNRPTWIRIKNVSGELPWCLTSPDNTNRAAALCNFVMMKSLYLYTLFALFLRGTSFTNQRTLQVRHRTGQSCKLPCNNAVRASTRSSISMHMGHSHTHDHLHEEEDHDDIHAKRTGPELSFSLWGQLLRLRKH